MYTPNPSAVCRWVPLLIATGFGVRKWHRRLSAALRILRAPPHDLLTSCDLASVSSSRGDDCLLIGLVKSNSCFRGVEDGTPCQDATQFQGKAIAVLLSLALIYVIATFLRQEETFDFPLSLGRFPPSHEPHANSTPLILQASVAQLRTSNFLALSEMRGGAWSRVLFSELSSDLSTRTTQFMEVSLPTGKGPTQCPGSSAPPVNPFAGRLLVHNDALLVYYRASTLRKAGRCAGHTSYFVQDVFADVSPVEVTPILPDPHPGHWAFFTDPESWGLGAITSLEPHVVLDVNLNAGRATEVARTSALPLFMGIDWKGELTLGVSTMGGCWCVCSCGDITACYPHRMTLLLWSPFAATSPARSATPSNPFLPCSLASSCRAAPRTGQPGW
ncbi:hypothetical protein PAPYR_4779 [Paratrimastix pyriformis]|uniref:Uncharacterized protein n=1 Tax=Paratrimastix pyriformis TaxID=342808 RepID=A0ABQ8UP14_9EUKA|nr:hypothetical protein PAPYR_4779 [Paratrimastix pyriformis]